MSQKVKDKNNIASLNQGKNVLNNMGQELDAVKIFLRKMMDVQSRGNSVAVTNGDIIFLRQVQSFLLELTNEKAKGHLNDVSIIKEMRRFCLAPIALRIDELIDANKSNKNLEFVSNFIQGKSVSLSDVIDLERCLYPLLPSPWNKIIPSGIREDAESISKRIKQLDTFSVSKERSYMHWRETFMTKIGCLSCPVFYKIEALCASMEGDLGNFMAYTSIYGHSFLSYYLIIKDLERIYGDSSLMSLSILEDAYYQNYYLKTRESMIGFSLKILRLYNIIKNSKDTNVESKMLKHLYKTIGTEHTSDFKDFCDKDCARASIEMLYLWTKSQIQKSLYEKVNTAFSS